MKTAGSQILVIDDDPDIRGDIIDALLDEGYLATGAADGVDAMFYLDTATELPRLILLDLNMPRIDGWQFLSWLSANRRFVGIPVVLIASTDPTWKGSAMRQISALLRKPIGAESLIEMVHRFAVPKKAK